MIRYEVSGAAANTIEACALAVICQKIIELQLGRYLQLTDNVV